LTTDLPTLAQRVKELREARGLSQQALAVAAGLSVSMVSLIEQGQREDPRVSTVQALADALGVSLDVLLGKPAPEPSGEKATTKKDTKGRKKG
jgi:transcriptional regulator with XRE-family HTH domain